MDRHAGGGGDSSPLVYSSSFHHSEEGRGQLLWILAPQINKEAACRPVCLSSCLRVCLSLSPASPPEGCYVISIYLPVKMLNAFHDFISPCLRLRLYAVSICPFSVNISRWGHLESRCVRQEKSLFIYEKADVSSMSVESSFILCNLFLFFATWGQLALTFCHLSSSYITCEQTSSSSCLIAKSATILTT